MDSTFEQCLNKIMYSQIRWRHISGLWKPIGTLDQPNITGFINPIIGIVHFLNNRGKIADYELHISTIVSVTEHICAFVWC